MLATMIFAGVLLVGPSLPGAALPKDPAANVVQGFQYGYGLPIVAMLVYDAETDPNHLLGRPGGYMARATWSDARLAVPSVPGRIATSDGGSVEVYATAAGAERRAEYLRAIGDAAPLFGSYTWTSGSYVLRVSSMLTPDQAEQYRAAFVDLTR